MNDTTYYPLPIANPTLASFYSLSSPSYSPLVSPRLSAPSESSAVQSPANETLGPLDAVIDGLAPHAGDSLERFLTARKRFLARSVEDLFSLIYQRHAIKYENIGRILYESAHLGGQLRELGDWMMGVDKGIDKTRNQIEREIASLERERRMEEVGCWQDVTRLKSDLRETLMEFNREKEKEHFLGTYAEPE